MYKHGSTHLGNHGWVKDPFELLDQLIKTTDNIEEEIGDYLTQGSKVAIRDEFVDIELSYLKNIITLI